MALEFLVRHVIGICFRIKIPGGANYYNCKSGDVKFFKVNSDHPKNMKQIPENAREMYFLEYDDCGSFYYGKPRFYDRQGKVLK